MIKKDTIAYLGLGTLPPSDVWKKLRRFDVKTSVSDLKIDLEAKKVLRNYKIYLLAVKGEVPGGGRSLLSPLRPFSLS